MDSFWPVTAKDWLYLLGGIASYTLVVIAFFYKIFVGNKIKEVQRRIFKANTLLQTQFGKHHHIEAFMDRVDKDRKEVHEQMGKLSNVVGDVVEDIHQLELRWLSEVGEIREEVREIQTKLDMILGKLSRYK